MAYHVNSKGEPGKCSAQAGNCPFGDENNHYSTADAARLAYEKTMVTEAFSSKKKAAPNLSAEWPMPAPEEPPGWQYGVKPEDLDEYLYYEYPLRGLSKEDQAQLYVSLRQSGGPALTPRVVSKALYYLKQGQEKDFDPIDLQRLKNDHQAWDKIASYLESQERQWGNRSGIYSVPPTRRELMDQLPAKTRELVLRRDLHGFPEDEMTNRNVAQARDEYLAAAAECTGLTPREVSKRIHMSVPVLRPLEGKTAEELQLRENHLGRLQRLTDDKKREIVEIRREKALREISGRQVPTTAQEWRELDGEFRGVTTMDIRKLLDAL